MASVMVTDGNNFHAADYHAEVTAEKIVVVGEGAPANVTAAARTFRKKVEVILTRHHTAVENAEQQAIAIFGALRYEHPLEAAVEANVLQEIVAASVGTILEAHFHRPDVQLAIVAELEHETRSQMNVHRAVHAEAARLAA
jgi:hypothetical protein